MNKNRQNKFEIFMQCLFIMYSKDDILKHSVAEDDIIDWDEDQLDDIPDEAHNDESHSRGLHDFGVLGLVWSSALIEEVSTVLVKLLEIIDNSL